MANLSPIESEFATTEDAEAYDRWFRAKVKAAMESQRTKVSHDEAMAQVRELIANKQRTASHLER